MHFQKNISAPGAFWLGLACVALVIGCDKAHEASPVGAAGAAASGNEPAAGRTAAGSGSVAGRSGSTAGAGAGASGRGTAGAGGSQSGASGGRGKPPTAGAPANGGAGTGGSAAGSGSAGKAGSAAASGGSNGAGKRCGTRGGIQCGADEFCNFEPDADCGATDRGGVCEARSQICPDIFKPVCGCDNRTHSSDCSAHSAGVSVKREGLCTPEECEAAGGRAEYSNGASIPECDAGEASWMISGGKEQVMCCLPQMAASGKTCGGIAALKCDPGQFCNYEDSASGQGCGSGIADAAGKCEEMPKACTRDFRPVCSCDRHSYDNLCEAHAAGVSVMRDGVCTESDCEMIGGRVVHGAGPAPMCNSGETEHGYVIGPNGIPIEGAICCLP